MHQRCRLRVGSERQSETSGYVGSSSQSSGLMLLFIVPFHQPIHMPCRGQAKSLMEPSRPTKPRRVALWTGCTHASRSHLQIVQKYTRPVVERRVSLWIFPIKQQAQSSHLQSSE